MTFKELVNQCDALNALTGRKFKVKGQNGVVCLLDETSSPYTPWTSNHKPLAQWMEFMRRGYEIGRAAPRPVTVSDVSMQLSYGIEDARKFAADLLEDVNDHSLSSKFQALYQPKKRKPK